MNKINKFKVVGLVVGLCLAAMLSKAAPGSITYVIPPTGVTNTLGAPILVGKVILSAGASSNVSLLAFDAPAQITTYSNVTYSTVTQYATNCITTWVNFFGATNSVTNICLSAVTNTVAATTNSYPARFDISALAATSAQIDNATFFFMNGVLLTNTSLTGTATITVEYAK